jgi:trimethylamine:corrinoid methyltransferase-like protein
MDNNMKDEKRYDKPFSHPRWHEPIGGKVVGHKELSEEEQKKAHEDALAVLKSMGIRIKNDGDALHDKDEK